jgi:ubiquinone/menaquinone biosynthesis C-methylase UbiE
MSIPEEANPAFYDSDSTTYDAKRWVSPAGTFTNATQQRIVQELVADWKDDGLEIGPGTARFTIPLLRQGMKMTVCDISPGMLEMARTNITGAGFGKSVRAYREGSIYELPFEDNSFDHAICLNVFNHLEDPGTALAEMSRVIKPGSTLLINYANLRSWYWPAARRINRRQSAVGQDVYSAWEKPGAMRANISRSGLELVRRVGHVHVPRELEKYRLLPMVKMLDRVSRRGPLAGMAAVHFCLCRKQ